MPTLAPRSYGDWLSPAELASYLGISLSSAYRLAWTMGARRRRHIGLRVRRALVDEHLAKPPPEPVTIVPSRAGTPVANPVEDDDEEVLPGLTRRMLKEQAGF